MHIDTRTAVSLYSDDIVMLAGLYYSYNYILLIIFIVYSCMYVINYVASYIAIDLKIMIFII